MRCMLSLRAQATLHATRCRHPFLAPTRHTTRMSAPPDTNATAAAQASSAAEVQQPQDPIIQYVVLRTDLWMDLGWPLGSVAAQAAHAATACQWVFRDDPHTVEYMADIDHMRKVVLEVQNEAALRALADQLTQAGIQHRLWIEQPENVATSLATKPYPKSIVGPAVRKLKLCRAPIGKK